MNRNIMKVLMLCALLVLSATLLMACGNTAPQTTDCQHVAQIVEGKAATCTATGLTEGKRCTLCGAELVKQEQIPALGHTEVVDEAKQPGCSTTGLTEGKHCSVCKEVLVAQEELAATGAHSYGDWVVTQEPTYEAEGVESATCTVCGDVTTRSVERLVPDEPNGHVWDEGTTTLAATCTANGVMTYKCTNEHCTATREEQIPAPGHTEVVDEAKAATCEEAGLTEGKHCSVCSQVITAQEEIPAPGHEYGEWIVTKQPTSKDEGEQSRTCSRCQKAETQKLDVIVPFTAEQVGVYTYKNETDGADATLTINTDGTITFADTKMRCYATEVGVIKKQVYNAFYEKRDGFTFTYEDRELGENEVTMYFEKGVLYVNVTGTPFPMLKPAEDLTFAQDRLGTYTGQKYGEDCSLVIHADGTINYTYVAHNPLKGETKTVTMENVQLSVTDDGYAFICENLVLFVFAEEGKITVTELGYAYDLIRA